VIAMEKLLLTPEEVAESLNIGRSRVYDMMRENVLRNVTIGRSRRVLLADLQHYVESLADPNLDR